MASLKELTALKDRVEQLRRDADKAAGGLEQTLKQLSEEFDCDTLEAAEKKLKEMVRKEAEAKAAFDTALEEFNEKHSEDL